LKSLPHKGARSRFREAVNAAVNLVRGFPGGGAPGPAGTRKTKAKGFPFTVVSRNQADEAIVLAIAPDLRQPGCWLARAR
jgi:hypothetical protein